MNVLFTAFYGKSNSSKILLDKIESKNKLYLKNSFLTSVSQFIKEISSKDYDLVISFGRAPLKKDNIKIEIQANGENSYITNYDFRDLETMLKLGKYDTIISNDAGNYLCNNVYYEGLKYINKNNLKTKLLFIHIPSTNNISSIDKLATIFNKVCNFNMNE